MWIKKFKTLSWGVRVVIHTLDPSNRCKWLMLMKLSCCRLHLLYIALRDVWWHLLMSKLLEYAVPTALSHTTCVRRIAHTAHIPLLAYVPTNNTAVPIKVAKTNISCKRIPQNVHCTYIHYGLLQPHVIWSFRTSWSLDVMFTHR